MLRTFLAAVLIALTPAPLPYPAMPLPGVPLPRMPELGGTITHIVVGPAGATDLYQIGWVPSSVVVAKTAWVYPKYAAGPFSASSQFTLGSGSDALDVVSFTLCAVFTPTRCNDEILYSNGDSTYIQVKSDCTVFAHVRGASGLDALTANLVTLDKPNVVCSGYDGAGSDWVQLNGGTAATRAVTRTVQTAAPAVVGAYVSHLYPFTGKLHEFMFSTSAWNTTAVAAIETTVIARLSAKP